MLPTLFNSWNESTVIYSATELAQSGGSVQREKNMFAMEITNTGDTIVFINNKILYPGVPGTSLGDAVSIGDPNGKIYKGLIKIVFQAPLGVLPRVEVSQLFYVP